MYKLHLILKYLRKRRIAWVSLAAVMLCTTMVLVVISVMGGWLRMFTASFQGLSGEVIVSARYPSGFPYYQEMAERIEQLPGVGPGGVVPVIRTFGLINIGNLKGDGVQVIGYPIDRIGAVNAFPQSLWRQHKRYLEALDKGELTETERYALGLKQREGERWPSFVPPLETEEKATPLTDAERRRLQELAEQGLANPSYALPYPDLVYETAARFASPRAPDAYVKSAPRWAGMIAGIGVIEIHRDERGRLIGRSDDLYQLPVKLTVMAIDPGGVTVDLRNKSERPYWIVDDSHTGVWQYDANTVYVPFEILQQDLNMAGVPDATDEAGNPAPVPPRTSELHIRVADGHDMNAVRDQVRSIVLEVYRQHGMSERTAPNVQTWRDTQAVFLNAIEKEKLLVTILFCIISLVAVFLIFCIFYMIVVEKTRDIGIIKAVGATREGVASIFLGYGLAIGLVGAGLGLLLAWLIVSNINELHAWLGRVFHLQIWDPQVYAFDTIPSTMDPVEVAWIMAVAVVSSVLGSLIPALRAASLEPIEALRYE